MIEPKKQSTSTPLTDKQLIYSKTPKHCNKSILDHESSPRLKTQIFTADEMDNMNVYGNLLRCEKPAHSLALHTDLMTLNLAEDQQSNILSHSFDRSNRDPPSFMTGIDHWDEDNSRHVLQQDFGSFSRAVSSSFGELTKPDFDKLLARDDQFSSRNVSLESSDYGSVMSEGNSDLSWKALHQVASVDEENFNRQFTRAHVPSPPSYGCKDAADGSPFGSLNLSSSSLSNSPGANYVQSFPTPSKMILLNSLSTIASSQKPLETCVTYESKSKEEEFYHKKRSSVETLDPPRKKSKAAIKSSLSDLEPPRFSLSRDSLNSEEMNNISQTLPRPSQPYLRLHAVDDVDSAINFNSSWDVSDRLAGSFTFDTCGSFGDSSHASRSETVFSNKDYIVPRPDHLRMAHDKNIFVNSRVAYPGPTHETRNQSFEEYFRPHPSDDLRDDSLSENNALPCSQSAPYYYHQVIPSAGPMLTHCTDYSKRNDREQLQTSWPPYPPHFFPNLPSSKSDFRTWSNPAYMHLQGYGPSMEFWRNLRNGIYGTNTYDIIKRQQFDNIHHSAVTKWTDEDDARLSNLMKASKSDEGDFNSIAVALGGGKSAKDCKERWQRYLKPGARKGHWQEHEDALILETILSSSDQPFTKWTDLASRLPGRVGKQIRDRWVNHLNPNIKHNQFTPEEDSMLWEGHKKHGNKWVEISMKVFQASRSENHVKNRFYSSSFKKFVANTFGEDAYDDRVQCDNKSNCHDLDVISNDGGEPTVAV